MNNDEVILDEISREIYDHFHRENWRSPVFADSEWLDLVKSQSSNLVFYSLKLKDGIIGVYALVVLKGKIFNHISLPSLTPHTGIILKEKFNTPYYLRLSLSALEATFIKSPVSSISIAFPPGQRDITPFKKKFWTLEPRLTYQINLKQPLEEILQKFRKDKKRNIKAAVKSGLEIRYEKRQDLMKELIAKSYKRREVELTWLATGLNALVNYPNSFQVTVYETEKPACSLFIVYDKSHAYYLFGGFDPNLENYNAGPYAMWAAIQKAQELGLEIFDFEGSELAGIESYFQSFGSFQEVFFRVSSESISQKIITKLR